MRRFSRATKEQVKEQVRKKNKIAIDDINENNGIDRETSKNHMNKRKQRKSNPKTNIAGNNYVHPTPPTNKF
ncbi:hypothetical protein [Companilactobacillus zhongbaensis]|uniref:hypothetical protein n=1 Tax=Companilactobacillus zhongbaensis TaxID=2486009 RepID=UPI001CDBBAB5|nr:hypothetical protein [Companilactobacillus zhongbaensis]